MVLLRSALLSSYLVAVTATIASVVAEPETFMHEFWAGSDKKGNPTLVTHIPMGKQCQDYKLTGFGHAYTCNSRNDLQARYCGSDCTKPLAECDVVYTIPAMDNGRNRTSKTQVDRFTWACEPTLVVEDEGTDSSASKGKEPYFYVLESYDTFYHLPGGVSPNNNPRELNGIRRTPIGQRCTANNGPDSDKDSYAAYVCDADGNLSLMVCMGDCNRPFDVDCTKPEPMIPYGLSRFNGQMQSVPKYTEMRHSWTCPPSDSSASF